MLSKNRKKYNGFGMVEAVVAISIIAIFVLLSLSVNAFYADISKKNKDYIQASFLIEEGVEAVKFMRDESWTTNIESLDPDTNYYLLFDGSWIATTTPLSINGFYRYFNVTHVYRDAMGDISQSGTLDNGTKYLEMKVEWLVKNSTTTRSVNFYISNIFSN